MQKSGCAVVAAALIVSGCASGQAAAPRQGVLPPGTAKLTVDGRQSGTTYSVRCQSIEWMTRVHADLNKTSVDAMLSTAGTLAVEFVRLHDVDGFTGSYERARQGEATVTMTAATYQITGTATGFNEAEPTRPRAETFALTVAC